jgi:hypothetical protein
MPNQADYTNCERHQSSLNTANLLHVWRRTPAARPCACWLLRRLLVPDVDSPPGQHPATARTASQAVWEAGGGGALPTALVSVSCGSAETAAPRPPTVLSANVRISIQQAAAMQSRSCILSLASAQASAIMNQLSSCQMHCSDPAYRCQQHSWSSSPAAQVHSAVMRLRPGHAKAPPSPPGATHCDCHAVHTVCW